MNTVLNSYGQLYGCPEILKKSCKFLVVGLTYGCPNTGHQDCWTPERRAAKAEFMKKENARRKAVKEHGEESNGDTGVDQ